MTNRDFKISPLAALAACATAVVLMTGCSSLKTPATADVAVSRAAVDNAASAGAADLAPDEMRSAREKMRMANQALKDRDYKTARDLADQAQADAKLAQSKANSAKATSAATAVVCSKAVESRPPLYATAMVQPPSPTALMRINALWGRCSGRNFAAGHSAAAAIPSPSGR